MRHRNIRNPFLGKESVDACFHRAQQNLFVHQNIDGNDQRNDQIQKKLHDGHGQRIQGRDDV